MNNHSLCLNVQREPVKTLKEGQNTIMILKRVLDEKKDPVIIKGKRYMEYGDWITLATFYGLSIRTHNAKPVEIHDYKGFQAQAELIRVDSGEIIGGAEAYCLENENNWKNKDYFQMASMAQTRAGSKALSNALRWVVELDKTMKGTPA